MFSTVLPSSSNLGVRSWCSSESSEKILKNEGLWEILQYMGQSEVLVSVFIRISVKLCVSICHCWNF